MTDPTTPAQVDLDEFLSFLETYWRPLHRDDRMLALIAEVRVHRWIPCSERMPEVLHDDVNDGCSEWVFVFSPSRGRDMAFWDGERWHWSWDGYAIPSEITHWSALPAPPAVKEPTSGS